MLNVFYITHFAECSFLLSTSQCSFSTFYLLFFTSHFSLLVFNFLGRAPSPCFYISSLQSVCSLNILLQQVYSLIQNGLGVGLLRAPRSLRQSLRRTSFHSLFIRIFAASLPSKKCKGVSAYASTGFGQCRAAPALRIPHAFYHIPFLTKKNNRNISKSLLLLFLLFQINISQSQILDSLKAALHQKPGIDLGYENRNSFLLNDTVRFQGIKLGLRFGKKLKLGLSFNWLKTNLYNQAKYFYDSSNDTTSGFFKMTYLAVYTKIVYHKTKRWEFSTPLQLGYGNSWLQKNPQLSWKHQQFKKNMIIYEPTVAVQFKILKWLGIAGNIGYRFVWHKEEKILSHLNGPIYVLNINLMLDQLFFEILPDSPITQKYGPAEW